MKGRIGILLSTSLLVTAGCFHYVPTRLGETSPGMEVRLLVSPEQAGRLNQQIGTDGELIRGRLVDQLDGELLIETRVVGSRTRIYQRVRIPLGEVVGVEARKLHPLNTGLLIGVLSVTTSAVLANVFGQGTNQQEDSCGHGSPRGTPASHSPSTHASPSSKCSFFQTGTSFLSRLIASRLAS